jgi:ribosomal protein S1
MESSVAADSDRTIETNQENDVKPKMHYAGTVVKTGLAGAIIDVGIGRPAVMHISQIVLEAQEQPIKRVEDVLKVGQQVDVWVKRVKDDRVELTMIKPLDLEWRDIKKGMTVKGQVVRLEKFGAFVEIGAERPGLIHISEMAHGYVRQPADVVKEGDEIEAQVIDVNRKKKQIKLSMKALEPEIEEFKPAKKENKKGGKRGPKREDTELPVPEEAKEPELTAMQMAWQEALDRANAEKAYKVKRAKSSVSREQEDLLERTMKKRLPTGG